MHTTVKIPMASLGRVVRTVVGIAQGKYKEKNHLYLAPASIKHLF